jgi:methylenetetrahydrofolate reductase (NADPH)
MKLSEIYKTNQVVYSLEVFPPKKDMPVETIYNTLNSLKEIMPDFISVTFGAGGKGGNLTAEIAGYIENTLKVSAMAHLTCVNLSRRDVTQQINAISDRGVENILALRGDIIPGTEPNKDFSYASELIEFAKGENKNISFAGACYPEGHAESLTSEQDIENLKRKVDAGAEILISQLFFDNEHFYNFIEKVRRAGITVPVSAGIMPATSKKQIERMVTMCGASLPGKLSKTMSRYENDPGSLEKAGIAYAAGQIADLIANGVQGIHLYTMNRADIAEKISACVKSLL